MHGQISKVKPGEKVLYLMAEQLPCKLRLADWPLGTTHKE
jgi:hypothetical protein